MAIDPKRWTVKLTEAVEAAAGAARAANNPEITSDHVLSALLGQEDGLALPILSKVGLAPLQVRNQLNERLSRLPHAFGGEASMARELRDAFDAADHARVELADEYLSVEHFLLANAQRLGTSKETLLSALREVRGNHRVTSKEPEGVYQALQRYGRDLTEVARKGDLDPVIGRDEEIRRVIQVLSRRTKNNPVLIGEPGVGKTAIVEGLAGRIVEGDVPEGLKGKRVIALDLASMVAGAKFRGEFEERLNSVLKEIKDADGEVITFIDELHTIVGAGAAGEGAMDAGNMIKPMLARGELRLIGATTLDEFRKHIESDAALERRFQQVYVGQPSVEDTVAILRGLKERYEVHHGVRIQDSALVAAAVLSDRYITGRFLPDKAIDLVDESASRLRIEIDSLPTEIDVVERRRRQLEIERVALAKETDISSLERLERIDREFADLTERAEAMKAQWNAEKEAIASIRALKEQLEHARIAADRFEREGRLGEAAEIRYGQLPQVQQSVEEASKALAELQSHQRMLKEEVEAEDVAEVVARWTGVPVRRLLEGEVDKLVRMEQVLHKRVVGQQEAVVAISNAIRRNRAGLSDPNRPIGSFLFLGPTGVGKTELARSVAEFLFDDAKAMIRIDMGEYQERHTVSRLVGAPPGYVGYDEGGQLTEAVRRRPYSVILLDEIEKAHSDVFNILLQVLDDGRLTDGQGRTVDFTSTVLIMTSNLAVEPSQFFKPEFVNRIDEIVRFQPLDEAAIEQIAALQIEVFARRMAERGLRLDVTPAALGWLAERGYDFAYGARPLRRIIQRNIGDPVALGILDASFGEGDTVVVDCSGDELRVFRSQDQVSRSNDQGSS